MPLNNFEEKVLRKCGSLFPFFTDIKSAIEYAKSVKKEFPDTVFELTQGETWGEQELVKLFN